MTYLLETLHVIVRSIQQEKPSPGVSKCNHPRCLTCPFLKQGQANYNFTSTKEKLRIHDPSNNKSKNLIYFIECKKCCKQYIGETKRHLHQRFGSIPAPWSTMATFLILLLSPNILINRSLYRRRPSYSLRTNPYPNRDSLRKVREAHLIDKAMILDRRGINRRN